MGAICVETQVADPPLPNRKVGRWLAAHSDGLLTLARSLLGNDQKSIDDYLRNYENPGQTVYEQIRLRMSLLKDLSRSN